MRSVTTPALLIALALMGSAAYAADAPPGTVGVVQTFGDLLEQKSIDIGDGVTIRLGVEATEAPLRGGVLVYCLTSGYEPPGKWTGDDRLGPVRMQVDRGRGERKLEKLSMSVLLTQKCGLLLYTRSVAMTRDVEHTVRVLTDDGRELARVVIKPADEPFHAWTPLAPPRERTLDRLRQADGDEPIVVGRVSNRPRGRALPEFDGMRAVLMEGTEGERQVKRAHGERLPTLLPAAPAEAFVLRRLPPTDEAPDRLLIDAGQPFIASSPHRHFLARWWVNGEPVAPHPLGELFQEMNGQVVEARKLELHLQFHPDVIGAKAGDRVALQLLHVPDGWEWAEDERLELLKALSDTTNHAMRMTNRVEWVVPKK